MKRFLYCGVAFAVLAANSAMAADLPARVQRAPVVPPPVVYAFSWSGFYIGGHGGGGWSRKCFEFEGLDEGCHDGSGWLGGGQVGYNWQAGNIVFGLEFSGSYADIAGSHVSTLDITDNHRSRVDGLLMFTGRVGWSLDRMLLYVTGGGAWARDRFEYSETGVAGTSTARQTRWGWTIGAGVEFAITPNWSVAGQYNYVDLGRRDASFSGGGFEPFTDRIGQELHLATLRLNYRFGGPVAARY